MWYVLLLNHCQIHPFSPFLLPHSRSGSYVLQRFCINSLTWPPGLLSDSIQIYSSFRDFSKLYIQLCQSSAKALQIYIYHCQDEAQACQHSLLTAWANLFCSFLSSVSFLLYLPAALNCTKFSAYTRWLLPSPCYQYYSLSLEWSPYQTFSHLSSLRIA